MSLFLARLLIMRLIRSSEAGQEAFARYSSLVSADELPFVRASGSDRVVATANNWTAGEFIKYFARIYN